MAERYVDLTETRYGEDNTSYATAISLLAGIYHDLAKDDVAEPLCRHALAIDEDILGPKHPRVAGDLNNLALLLMDSKRSAEAEPFFRRALAIDEKISGSDSLLPETSTTWPCCLWIASGRPRPSRSFGVRSPSTRRPWTPTISTWPETSTT